MGIAVDHISSRVFWTDCEAEKFRVVKLRVSNFLRLFTTTWEHLSLGNHHWHWRSLLYEWVYGNYWEQWTIWSCFHIVQRQAWHWTRHFGNCCRNPSENDCDGQTCGCTCVLRLNKFHCKKHHSGDCSAFHNFKESKTWAGKTHAWNS